MPLLNDNCSRCHTAILGRPKDMFRSGYGVTKSWAEPYNYIYKNEVERLGEMTKYEKKRKQLAKCPECGRTQTANAWITVETEKTWHNEDEKD